METLIVHLQADDLWLWAIRLHNICHAEPGMITVHSHIS